ncbi:MAG TPA: hypothetical protein VGM30_20665 [Puia sp.]|jgi:hypothetical protein
MLGLLFYTQLGYYGQFMILQWRMKEAAREAWLTTVADDQLYRISLADLNASGRWEEEGRECWFRDHLYDVVRQEKIDGKTYLFCLDDEGETQLIRQSGEMTRANLDQPGKKDTHPSLLKMGDILPAENSLSFTPVLPDREYTSCFIKNKLPLRDSDISVPPPKSQRFSS